MLTFHPFFRNELTITKIQEAMDQRLITSKELVMFYMKQIASLDQSGPALNSILEINPEAIFIAEALDEERKRAGKRSDLHGIPILLKDNIETGDFMRTSAGTLALQYNRSTEDAYLVKKLRHSGAVVLGKTNMTELSNGMSSTMWAGYSAKGGQVLHPYGDPEMFVGGSSSGSAVAVAANLTVLAVGTETDASILSPAVQNSVVGIKPTIGLISRSGIIPFTYTQDTAGSFARTVKDAAILLEALVGVDEEDPSTYKRREKSVGSYVDELNEEALNGARIGIFTNGPASFYQSGEYDEVLFFQVVQDIKDAGAMVIEGVDIPSFHRKWSDAVLRYELRHSLDNYLQTLPAHAPVHTVNELIKFNEKYAETALKYGQNKLEERSEQQSSLRSADYIHAKLEDLYYAQEEGIDYTLKKYGLDAIVFPAYLNSTISAKAGYPSIAVPAGYQASGRPFGITFAGGAFSEKKLIQLAYAFEQKTKHRKSPRF
ncbi:amidase family protein [Priestia koreensis]|uniref:amidase family protein n=1 Tax=Priestia koreensis TaxID=284581 RepID=UPI00301B26FA